MDNYILVQNIRKLCVEKNIKITALEKALGFPQGRINKWTDSTPSIDKVAAVADYFHVTIDSLLKNNIVTKKYIFSKDTTDRINQYLDVIGRLQDCNNHVHVDRYGIDSEIDWPRTMQGQSDTINFSTRPKQESSNLKINRLQELTMGKILTWHKIDMYNIQNTDIQKLYDSMMSQNPYLDCYECRFMKGALLMFQSFDASKNEEHNEAYLYIQGREDSYPLLIESGQTLFPLVQDIYEQTDTQSVYQSVNHIIDSLNNL